MMLTAMIDKLRRALQRQLGLNEGVNLLHAGGVQLLEIDGVFLAALEELVSGGNDTLSNETVDAMAAAAAAAFIEKIYARNQFIHLEGQAKEALKQIYVDSWHTLLRSRQLESTLRDQHYPKIKRFLASHYPKALAEGLRPATELSRVPSSEYSAELQLRLLRVDLDSLKEPILDIGCGAEAHLVRFLRLKHLEAYGFDRSIEDTTDYLFQADWFDYEYGSAKWGTIISNLSFANHVVFAQRYNESRVIQYLIVFSKILDSLVGGVQFIFAPAPDLLAGQVDQTRYAIERWEIASAVDGMRISSIAR
jgi:hypothetical protein